MHEISTVKIVKMLLLLQATLEDEKVKDKVPEKDVKFIVGKCEETIKWLDANQMGEKEEYEDRQKELEKEFNPIITRLYGSGAGQ